MDTKALRQKILDLAIRGKLVPQDPNDEPASVLLEKIRAEKQQMVKDGRLKAKDIKNDTIIFKGEDNLHYEKFQDGTVKCIEDEIPFELPEGWEWTRLASVLSLSSGKSLKVRQLTSEEEFPVYGGNGINGTHSDYNVDSETIIIGRVGYYCGSVYKTSSKAWVTDNALIATIKEQNVFDIDFLVAILKYLDLGKTSVSTAQPVVSGKGILPLIVPVPPKDEQNRINKSYSEIMPVIALIENDKEEVLALVSKTKSKILDLAIRGQLVPQDPNDEPASVLLERIRAEKEELIKQGKIKRDKKESIIFKGEDNSYYEKFSDGKCHCIDDELPFELPDGWEWCNLSMIGTTNIGLTYRPADIEPDGTIVLRSSNIVNDEIDLNDLVRVKTKIRENQYVQPNDILICARNGSKALVGKCALVNNLKEPTSFGAFMAIYRTNYNKYVMHYLRTSLFRSVFNDGNSTAINQLTQDMLKRALIPFPPILEQEKIVNVVSKLFIHLHGIEKSLN